jgi:predicted protein tyrosine phosphatase
MAQDTTRNIAQAMIGNHQDQDIRNSMRRVLFICGQNQWRSPTAEVLFSERSDLEVISAGLNHGSENPVTLELVQWADIIFVMEAKHRKKLCQRFRASLKDQRVICLDIPDRYPYMDPQLIELLQTRVSRHLRARS